MSKTLITTVIPTYKRPTRLRRAILSVLNQTYPYFQVCIYDNNSGDNTAEVVADIAKKDSRVKYFCHSCNIGPIPNFNFGIKQVDTPFFSLLSDDNTLLPHFYEEAIDALDNYSDAMFFGGRTILLNDKRQVIGSSLNQWEPGLIRPPDGLLHIYERGIPTWESVLFRSIVIKSVGLLDASVHGAADYDFMMRIARKHIYYISKRPYATFCCHSNSVSGNRDLNESISSGRKILNRWLNDRDLSDDMKKRLLKRRTLIVKKRINSKLLESSIRRKDVKTIAVATELMRKEIGLSYGVLKAIMIAKLLNYNRFLQILLSAPIWWYLKIKCECARLKNRKTYKNFDI